MFNEGKKLLPKNGIVASIFMSVVRNSKPRDPPTKLTHKLGGQFFKVFFYQIQFAT
jgi:hypothetical protein